MSDNTLSPLALDIHALVSAHGPMDSDTVRERLTVASEKRFRAAVRELLVAGHIHNTCGVIRLPGLPAKTGSASLYMVWKSRREARSGAAVAA